jgi:hypothetical protein
LTTVLKYLIPVSPNDESASELVRISMMMYQFARENQANLHQTRHASSAPSEEREGGEEGDEQHVERLVDQLDVEPGFAHEGVVGSVKSTCQYIWGRRRGGRTNR